jgi:hypothetical protein
MNYTTPWQDSVTEWLAASMNPPLEQLDEAITYGTKCPIVHCDGAITWAGGTLTWAGTIRILFNRDNGNVIENTIAASSIALSDNQFAYVDLSETNGAAVTMSAASITTGAASNFLALARLVMAYRNTTSDDLYPVWLPIKFAGSAADKLDGREQSITCADNVTIDWSNGGTARMTFDRDSVALTLSGGENGKVYRLLLVQSGGGSDTLSWSTSVKWRGGAAPTLSTDGGAEDILTLVRINGAWYGDIAEDFA